MFKTIKIKKIVKKDTARVYDLGVDETHNFFVGNSQILTSNCDGLTEQGQRALRNTMEEYAKYTRFILTANQLHRIIPALQSRCQSIQVESSLLDVVMRCMHILKQEGIAIDENQKQQLIKHVKMMHPDVRRIISNLQRMCASGNFALNNNDDKQFATQLLQNILSKNNCNSIREFIINNEESFGNDYNSLLKNLLNATYESDVDETKKQMMICIIAEHLYRCSFAMDQEINAFHCCLNIANAI